MDSKRIWVAKDYDVGYKSKSHMAEFSSNPDGRNKRDSSFNEYKKRLNIEEDIRMKNRISVNKLRDKQGLDPFLNQNEYEEIVEESELEGQNLVDFLIQYNLDLELADNLKKFIPSKKTQNIKYKILKKNNILYIKLGALATLLRMDMKKLLEVLESSNTEFINNKLVYFYPSTNNIYKEIKNEKSIYFISYSLILALAYYYKKENPKSKLNQDFFILISNFKKHDIGLGSYTLFTSLFVDKYFRLFRDYQK